LKIALAILLGLSAVLSVPGICQAQPYTITTVAGVGETASGDTIGDGGPATRAYLLPTGVAADSSGNLYIADPSNSLIRKVTSNGIISTVAGDAVGLTAGYAGDGGPATSALLNFPQDVAVDSSGALYIADRDAANVRKVTPDGTITTVAGCRICISLGDGGPATNATLSLPYAVAVDSAGALYIADTLHFRIRKVSADGTIATVAGSGAASYSGDGGPAISAGLNIPKGVAVDSAGNIYIADTGDQRIRMVTPDGAITTIAGNGDQGLSGSGGSATSASLMMPGAMVVGAGGTLYFVDSFVVWLLTPTAPSAN
jgi:hypothetical protein